MANAAVAQVSRFQVLVACPLLGWQEGDVVRYHEGAEYPYTVHRTMTTDPATIRSGLDKLARPAPLPASEPAPITADGKTAKRKSGRTANAASEARVIPIGPWLK